MLALAALAACSGNASQDPLKRGSGTAVTSTAGPATPERAAVQLGDLPKGFRKCSFSGPVNDYIENFRKAGSDYQSLVDSWTKLQSAGAVDGYFAVYGNMQVACDTVLGKKQEHDPGFHDDPKGHPSTVWSFVVRYGDDDSATGAFKADVFGQSQLQSQGMDVIQGPSTGLGPNSTVGTNQADAPVRQAIWQNKAFTVFFGSENLQPEESEDATSAIDGRIN